MRIEISAIDIFNRGRERLAHLTDCRRFLDAFTAGRHEKPLIEKQAKDKYEHNRGRVEKKLTAYLDLCKTNVMRLDMNTFSPVERWLTDVEELERAEDVVDEIYSASGYGGDELPNVEPHRFADWIRRLHDFDDSE